MLSAFKNYPNLKLVFVMILIPVLLNAIQFWIIDNILKFKPANKEEVEAVDNMYKNDAEADQIEMANNYKTEGVKAYSVEDIVKDDNKIVKEEHNGDDKDTALGIV